MNQRNPLPVMVFRDKISSVAVYPDEAGTPLKAPERNSFFAGGKAAPPPPAPAADRQASSPASSVKVTRVAWRTPPPRIPVLKHRSLWLAPLLAETVLCVGAIWLTLCLEAAIWVPESGFPVLSFIGLALAYAGFAVHSHKHELFMPRAVVLVGVGSLVLATLGVGVYLVLEGYFMGGLYRLRYVPLVGVPLALFLGRSYLVFSIARRNPTLNTWVVNTKPKGDRLRALRAKLRFWLS